MKLKLNIKGKGRYFKILEKHEYVASSEGQGKFKLTPGGGGGGYSVYLLVGRCGAVPITLTLFKTNIADFPTLLKTEFRFFNTLFKTFNPNIN